MLHALAGSHAYAGSVIASTDPTVAEWTDGRIYQATKEACSATSAGQAFGHSFESNHLRIGHFRSANFNRLLNQLQINAARTAATSFNVFTRQAEVYAVINNHGFQQALSECYPSESRMIQFFETSVLRAEEKGRISIIAIYGGTSAGLASGLTAGLAKLGVYGQYISRTLNFSQVIATVYEFYQARSAIIAQKKQMSDLCGSKSGEEFNTCKKNLFFNALETKEQSLRENAPDLQEMREFLIDQAQKDISALTEERKRASSPKQLESIDDRIAQRQKFLSSQK